ncbi:MAG: hypothetical protein ACOVRM_00445 [Planctomycetaceae bacterium]
MTGWYLAIAGCLLRCVVVDVEGVVRCAVCFVVGGESSAAEASSAMDGRDGQRDVA